MRVSGWLPVSYSVYMEFEKKIGKDCYNIAKMVADTLNDTPKIKNMDLLLDAARGMFLDDRLIINQDKQYIDDIEKMIDFIRDSLIIYQDTIRQEQQDTIGAVLT